MKWENKYNIILTNITWERIFLNFDIWSEYENELSFFLVQLEQSCLNAKQVKKNHEKPIYEFDVKEKIEIFPENVDKNKYSFSLNLSAANENAFLNNGKWILFAYGANSFHLIRITPELAYELDNKARVFRYGRGKYAYNVSFGLVDYIEEDLVLWLHSYFMKENATWKKRRYIEEATTIRGKLNRAYMYLVIRLIRGYYYTLSHIFPKKGNRVLFMSETKDYLWGNLKSIYERIKTRKLDTLFQVTYSCRKAVGNHTNIFSWIKTVTLIAKNDFIFIDDYAPIFGFFKLHPKTKLIQVWHAGEGFKSVGYSRFGKKGSPFPSESCHKAYDYALVGANNLIKVYEEVFGLPKRAFLPTGMARLDDFLNEHKIEEFRNDFYKSYNELADKKIILFAPTFRGTGQKDAHYDYDMLDLKQIYEFCGNEWAFLVKMHPFVKEAISIPDTYQDRIKDFSSYPNINDLYYITDVLITDYSSNYYEYALLRKPVLFYTYDREYYELKRGVHRDVKSHAPGKVCDTFEELMSALKQKDFEKEKIDQFVENNFIDYDGHAADRAIDEILLKN